jgi:hypothetical protein
VTDGDVLCLGVGSAALPAVSPNLKENRALNN